MDTKLEAAARLVLDENRREGWTVPAGDLYPHQWLWDSCFIAIGLRHIDIERAKTELESLLRGQWANGMIPHLIFNNSPKHRREHKLWQSWLSPHAPDGVITSGLTQPPMLAEAIWRVAEKLQPAERRTWLAKMLPHLIRHHAWLYRERAGEDRLIRLIHPYESGFDNSPPWSTQIRLRAWPWWLKTVEFSRLARLVNLVRRDIRHVPPGQRMSNIEALAYWNLQRRLRNQAYDSDVIFKKPKLAVSDLAFNCIFIRANERMEQIAKSLKVELPVELITAIRQTRRSLEALWDEDTDTYLSRDDLSGNLINEPNVATLLPLYAMKLDAERAKHLVALLNKRSLFRANWPLPSVPLNSPWFKPLNYWQGPTWININWLVIDGLKRNGFVEEADALRSKTLGLVDKSGCYEYFSPLDGSPAGAENFSWTAALVIDLLRN